MYLVYLDQLNTFLSNPMCTGSFLAKMTAFDKKLIELSNSCKKHNESKRTQQAML